MSNIDDSVEWDESEEWKNKTIETIIGSFRDAIDEIEVIHKTMGPEIAHKMICDMFPRDEEYTLSMDACELGIISEIEYKYMTGERNIH